MNGRILIVILSLVAGVVGTTLGGVIGVFVKSKGRKLMGGVLGFAGGLVSLLLKWYPKRCRPQS